MCEGKWLGSGWRNEAKSWLEIQNETYKRYKRTWDDLKLNCIEFDFVFYPSKAYCSVYSRISVRSIRHYIRTMQLHVVLMLFSFHITARNFPGHVLYRTKRKIKKTKKAVEQPWKPGGFPLTQPPTYRRYRNMKINDQCSRMSTVSTEIVCWIDLCRLAVVWRCATFTGWTGWTSRISEITDTHLTLLECI